MIPAIYLGNKIGNHPTVEKLIQAGTSDLRRNVEAQARRQDPKNSWIERLGQEYLV